MQTLMRRVVLLKQRLSIGTVLCVITLLFVTTPASRAQVEVGIFRGGFLWLIDADGNRQFNSPPDRSFAFGGIPGDIPITGDWSGSGTTKVGIYRSSNGLFLLDYNGDGIFDST